MREGAAGRAVRARRLVLDRKPSSLILVEAESPAAVEFRQNANSLLQELSLLALLLIQSSSNREQQHLNWCGQHAPNVPFQAPHRRLQLASPPRPHLLICPRLTYRLRLGTRREGPPDVRG